MPVTLAGGDQTQVGASIGIACFPAHGTTGEALLQAADAAMYQVKQSGKNGYRFSGSADSG
jgi:diguanylate cyclase (GGDEF)-like protein